MIDELKCNFARLRAASRAEPAPSYQERRARLDKLLAAVLARRHEVAEVISADFGNRSADETQIAEIFTTVSLIKYLRSNLRGWMKTRSRHMPMTFRPATARVHYQPLGVVGVIAPWNYPFQLALTPLATAIAAGNRVMLKPSELTPRTSELLQQILGEVFDDDVVSVATGGPDVGQAFSALPFDHLLFTGSTAVGKHVMRAAAENLTPVTLELGGKSPTIVHESYPLRKAAERIASGKFFNAGQTCIAPDYILCPQDKVDELVGHLQEVLSASFPTLAANGEYTAVVNDAHHTRLSGLVRDAEAKGARKIEVNPASEELEPAVGKIAPTLLLDVNDDMSVMRDEIFGPVLPIVPYGQLDEAIAYVNDRPRPLALYYFDRDSGRARTVLERTVSGGACVNETVFHFVVDDMPFGGVGPSGIGAYHGKEGFETFSHKKSVFYQSRLNGAALMSPPYGDRVAKMLGMLLGK